MTDKLSNCCTAQISYVTGDEGTGYMKCVKCDKPCDFYVMKTNNTQQEELERELWKKMGFLKSMTDEEGMSVEMEETIEDLAHFILQREKDQRKRIKSLRKLKFKRGERPWCTECLNRIIKALEE